MKKCKESILLGLALLVICTGPAVSSSIVVSDTSGNPGDTAVLVKVSLINDVPYAGSEVGLRYNSTVLDLNRIETGPRLFGQSGTGYYEFSSGQASFVVFDFDGVSLPADSGIIFNLYFDLAYDSSGVHTEISISEITAVSDDLEYDTVTVKNGSISIRGRGDCSGDYVIDLGDVLYLINYLYKYGPAPDPLWTGDANSDDVIDLGDVLYLINYLYKGGPAPCQSPEGMFAKFKPASAEVSLQISETKDEQVSIFLDGKFDIDVSGVQLEFKWDKEKLELSNISQTTRTEKLGLYHNSGKDGELKVGMLDIKGKEYISAGEGALLKVNMKSKSDSLDLSSLEIKEALLFDENGRKLAVNIVNKVGEPNIPKEFSLSQNYPNPFNPQTVIKYALPHDCEVKITIYNILGQKVRTLVDEYQNAGYKRVEWNSKNERGEEIASGVYFYRIKAGEFTQSKKMVILK